MHKQKAFISGIMLCAVVFAVAGCSATKKKVEVRSYFKDEPRIDQELSGNRGYFVGQPQSTDDERKQTRKIFVVEVIQPAPELPDLETKAAAQTTVPVARIEPQPVRQQPQPQAKRIVIPSIDDEPVAAPTVASVVSDGAFTEYVVEKDDTLQKISKKFYNTYNKWPKIYEANKDVIKNPDFVAPGTTLRIPTLQ